MALLTVAQLRQHVESDLSDDALQRLLDAAEAEIDAKLGAVGSQVQTLRGERVLHLARKASTITTVVEADVDLDAEDYELLGGGYRLRRLTTGPNPSSRWQGCVTVTYAPVDTTAQRKILQARLVQLDMKDPGVSSWQSGDVRFTNQDPAAVRIALFRDLALTGRRLIL